MVDVKIYRPGKTTMQSGRAKRLRWVLEYETTGARSVEPLMGWTSADDTLEQVTVSFGSCEDAVSFAKKRGWNYAVLTDCKRTIKPRNYTDNFKYIPLEEEKRT